MKKWLPWILLALCASGVLSTLRPVPEPAFHTREFGRLPVLLDGRVQPLDSVARNALLQIRSKQSVVLEQGQRLTAIEWLLEVLMKPELSDDQKFFRVDHPELLDLLKLPKDSLHFSFNQLLPGLEELEKQARRVNDVEEQLRNPFEKQVMRLFMNLNLYRRLKNSLAPEDSEDFAQELVQYQKSLAPGVAAVRAQEAGKDYDKEAFKRIAEFLVRYDAINSMAYPLLVPPQQPEISRDEWKKVGTVLMEAARGNPIPIAVTQYAAMAGAYRHNDPASFNQALAAYRQHLDQRFPAEVRKGRLEFFFNDFHPFYDAMIVYLLAFLITCGFFFNLSGWWRASAFNLTALAWVLHTFGLIFRMVLEHRPPVTNLYSSAIFVGWGGVLLALILERFFPLGLGVLAATVGGFITQVIAHNLALEGDTMKMLVAVLDTNFWLATHVVTVTLGYASTFLAGLLAVIYVLLGIFTRGLSAERAKILTRMVYGIVCFATLFSFTGTVLGGIWADQSWGRFWGWDPKENGALIIVLWNAIILHARWDGLVGDRGLMNMAILGNTVTSFSWFGVNMLGIGLHTYGFMEKAFIWLMIFVASQFALIALSLLIPQAKWLSFKPAVSLPIPPAAPALS